MTDSARFTEPVFGAVYGAGGSGKSSDFLFAFGGHALFVAPPGSLKPWRWIGLPHEPAQVTTAKLISDFTAVIEQHCGEKKGKKQYRALVIDDWSLAADYTVNAYEQGKTQKGKLKGFDLWGQVRDDLLRFREVARWAGIHVLVNAHERGPHNDEKKGYVRGGLMLPGTMPEDMAKACDMALRVVYSAGEPLWPYVYHCDPDDQAYVEKDRNGLTPVVAPLNIAEILRQGFGSTEGASPFPILRPAGLEWMEESVEKLAGLFKGKGWNTDEHFAIRKAAVANLRSKRTQDDRLVAWVIRDAAHRAQLREQNSARTLAAVLAGPVKSQSLLGSL